MPLGPGSGSWSFLQSQKELDGARVDSGYEIWVPQVLPAQLGSLQAICPQQAFWTTEDFPFLPIRTATKIFLACLQGQDTPPGIIGDFAFGDG